jgi:hypothetical protein
MEVSGQLLDPADLFPGKRTPWSQSGVGGEEKISQFLP